MKHKKDRKRKRHPNDTNTEQPSPPKKQKKRKRDKQAEPGSHTQPSAPSEGAPAIQIAIKPTSTTDASAFLTKHSITVHTPPSLPPVIPVTSFDQLQVPDALKAAFKDFKEPTPIQACAWPPALQGHDVVGIAETGRYVR